MSIIFAVYIICVPSFIVNLANLWERGRSEFMQFEVTFPENTTLYLDYLDQLMGVMQPKRIHVILAHVSHTFYLSRL